MATALLLGIVVAAAPGGAPGRADGAPLSALFAAAQGSAGSGDARQPAGDPLRIRVEFIDTLLAHAQAARSGHRLSAGAYREVLHWLRAEELGIHAQARARTYANPEEHNYWFRGRLKFPTLTEQALSHLGR